MKKEYLFVIISGILSGTILLCGQYFVNLGFSLYELAILPFVFITILLAPFIISNKKYRVKTDAIPILIAYGVAAAFLAVTQFGALLLNVPVAMVALLLYTQPLWTIIISKFFFKEEVTKKSWIACILVLLGIFFLFNPFTINKKISAEGLIVGLIGGISLSLWIIIGSHASKKNIHPVASKFWETTIMLIIFAIILPIAAIFIKNPTITLFRLNWPIMIWIVIFLFTLFGGIINHLFYLTGVKIVPTIDAGIIMLLEPIVAALLAIIFFQQSLTWNISIGGLFILAANYIVIRK
jgi:drug/metabolite transporter (DMT)-like permease